MRRRLGAPPVRDIASMLSQRMILLPVSRQVAPPDARWPGHVRQTGYWFAQPDAAWRPPPEALRFIEQGERPLAVTLGVMGQAGRLARPVLETVLAALAAAGARAIVQGWDDRLGSQSRPGMVFPLGPAPHAWLFEQVSAVIHHGGFGTTAAVLRAGVPGVVIPHVIDQFYWAQRVHELGVGPKFISRGRLEAASLRSSIAQALGDEGMRHQAAELGRRIRAEPDGVTSAVEQIERAVGARAPVLV
jgi:sterol 3beta-glucosyltransferase